MYSDKQLDELLEPIIGYYSRLEQDLIKDICKRLKPDKLSGTAEWKFKKLRELGALNKSNIKKISRITKISEKQINKLIEDVGLKAISDDNKLYLEAFGELPPISKSTLDILGASQKQAKNFQNLVGSKAFESSKKEFKNIVEKLFTEVNLGQIDYNTALRTAVTELSDKGLTGMTYKSEKGKITRWNLDTAIRQMLLDSTTRTAGQMQLDRAKQVGVNLVEVSSHLGERPSHAVWSGRIYQLKGSGKYPNFYKATHYGERSARALHGFNCKHQFYPFIENVSEPTFKPQSKARNDRIYSQRTQQRYNERQIRLYKKRMEALKAVGDKEGARQANIKIKQWQGIQRQYLKKTPILQRDYSREQIS